MSVVGVLAVGTAAAALNVRLLHSASVEPARLAMQTTSGMTVLNPTPKAKASPQAASTAAPSRAASAAPTTAPAIAPSKAVRVAPTQQSTAGSRTSVTAASSAIPSAQATASASTKPLAQARLQVQARPPARPLATARLTTAPKALAGVAVPSGDDGGEPSGDGGDDEQRLGAAPQLTVAQMNVLRIAAMAHVRPEVVIAAAKGDADAQTLHTITQIAQYIGVDLASLADVVAVPRLGDRWHGNPNDHGGTNSDY